jgi:putative (di)nucleoside polyphosphate hydrolase
MKLRENVAGILQNGSGKILICERYNTPGAWQFPQGGVDEGETHEEALVRELGEEISLKPGDFTILEQRGPYQYLYGEGRLVRGHHGKIQHYFLARLDAPASRINVATEHPEFRDIRWIEPGEFKIKWLPEMKHEVYRAVFRDFFGVLL